MSDDEIERGLIVIHKLTGDKGGTPAQYQGNDNLDGGVPIKLNSLSMQFKPQCFSPRRAHSHTVRRMNK